MPENDSDKRSLYRKACALLRFHGFGDPSKMTDDEFATAYADLQWVLSTKQNSL